MITIKNAEGAYAAGMTRFDKWQAKIDEQWYRPVVRTQLAIFLKSLPPEIAGQYAQEIQNLEETIGVEQQHGGYKNARLQSLPISWQGANSTELQPQATNPVGPLR